MRLCSRVQYHLAVGQNPRKPGKIPSHLCIGNCDRDFLTHGGEYMIFKAIAPSVSETKHICWLMVPTGSAVGWKTLCFLSKMELQSQTVGGQILLSSLYNCSYLSRSKVLFQVAWLNSACMNSEEPAIHRETCLCRKNINCRGSVILWAGGNEQ